MVRPARLLLLLIYVAVLLGLAGFFLPKEYKITNELSLHFFDLPSILRQQKIQYANIQDIRTMFEEADSTQGVKAPLALQSDSAVKDTAQVALDKRFIIQYPDGADTLLYTFFRSVAALKQQDTLVRVLHYGDSQIEGDRITAALRNRLQQRFGGCGVGLVPLLDPLGNRNSLLTRSDEAWKKLPAYGPGYRKKAAAHYGIMGSYFQYSFAYPVLLADSTATDSIKTRTIYRQKKWQTAAVTYLPSATANALDKRAENIKILYRNPGKPVELNLEVNGSNAVKQMLDTGLQSRIYRYPLLAPFKKLQFTFGSSRSPELYGIALDCNKGIAVDNMPFRGSSGVDFTRMDKALLQQQIEALNVQCIILQFGVNVVPYVTNDYSYYEKQFYKQLKLLRSIAPKVSILVVGVSDMSRKEGEMLASYPNIEKIRDAQRRAAFRAGCAFWDLFTAMGGKDSMPSWVAANPPLANKDYTHFTPRGARIVSEMLYKALMSEYETYEKRL